MAGIDVPVGAEAPPALEQAAGYQSVRPEIVSEFAREFSALLTVVSSKNLDFQQTQQLNSLLDSFESLAEQMRAVRQALQDAGITRG